MSSQSRTCAPPAPQTAHASWVETLGFFPAVRHPNDVSVAACSPPNQAPVVAIAERLRESLQITTEHAAVFGRQKRPGRRSLAVVDRRPSKGSTLPPTVELLNSCVSFFRSVPGFWARPGYGPIRRNAPGDLHRPTRTDPFSLSVMRPVRFQARWESAAGPAHSSSRTRSRTLKPLTGSVIYHPLLRDAASADPSPASVHFIIPHRLHSLRSSPSGTS